MSLPEAVARAAVLKAINDKVGAAYGSARKALDAAGLDPGDRKTARLDDGTKIGAVTMTDPQPKPKVKDPAAFLAWVKQHAPGEIVESVRTSYTSTILKRCEANGAAVNKDGEVIAGIEFATSDPHPTVTQSEAEAVAVAEAFARGDLAAILRGTPIGELE